MEQIEKLKSMPRLNQIGILAPLAIMVSIVIGTSILPNFDWSSNPLSDLGSWFRTDLGDLQILSAILFNGGLIVTGLFIAYFIISLVKQSNDIPTKIGLLFFAGTAILLASVGVFSEDFPLPHGWSAILFFFSIPVALGVIGLVWVRLSEIRIIGGMTLLFAFLSILLMFQPWITLSIAVFETLAALIAAGWVWFVNFMHYKGRFSPVLANQDA